jgi:hypothetical protein
MARQMRKFQWLALVGFVPLVSLDCGKGDGGPLAPDSGSATTMDASPMPAGLWAMGYYAGWAAEQYPIRGVIEWELNEGYLAGAAVGQLQSSARGDPRHGPAVTGLSVFDGMAAPAAVRLKIRSVEQRAGDTRWIRYDVVRG